LHLESKEFSIFLVSNPMAHGSEVAPSILYSINVAQESEKSKLNNREIPFEQILQTGRGFGKRSDR
jgi:hypothetical protein